VEPTVELDDITRASNHSLRHKSCRPISGGVAPDRDEDVLGCRYASTGKNLERTDMSSAKRFLKYDTNTHKKGRKVHHWRKGGIARLGARGQQLKLKEAQN